MSTKVKNTLYRFVTMRAPELLNKFEVDDSFVQHPEVREEALEYESVFLNALNPVPPNRDKKMALREAADDFEPNAIKSRIKLREFIGNKNLYDFAIWLTKNRITFTNEEVEQWVTNQPQIATQELDDEMRIQLWDNLIYQIITFKSNYVRDEIISVLVADFYVGRYKPTYRIAQNRKLAQARILLPKVLFEPEVNEKATDIVQNKKMDQTFNYKEMDKAKQILIMRDQKKQLETIKAELKAIERKYKIEVKKLQRDYDDQFKIDTQTAYENATAVTVTHTDPVTEEITHSTEYQDLILPTYNFKPPAELDFAMDDLLKNGILFEFLNRCFTKLSFRDFSDVYDFVDEKIKELTTGQFERTITSKRVVNVNGVVLSASDSNSTNNYARLNGGFVFMTLRSGTNRYLGLIFTGMEPGTDIISGNYLVTFADDTTLEGEYVNEDTNIEWVNGKLHLKIFNYQDNYFTPEDTGIMSITGTFVSSVDRSLHINGSGRVVQWSGPNTDIAHIDDDGNPAEYTNSTVAFTASGKGTYDYQDVPSGSTGSTGSTDTDPSSSIGGTPTDVGTPTPKPNEVPQTVINYIPSGYGIKRLGIADYRKVEQEICCYVPGEVSHIENIMAREYKEKATRRLRRQEDTTTISKEKETEKLTDTTSTDRFEMNQEVSSVLAEDTSFGAFVNTGYNHSGFSLNAGADFASNTSQETSDSQAVTSAQEVTERVLDRVVQKIKEERITKVIEEFEETSKHGYDNRKGDKHISGVYRWVDKIYRNQVVNYGKRLIYEFMIPEPAVFHNMAIENRINTDDHSVEEILKPIDPRALGNFSLTDYTQVTEANYMHWATIYKADVQAIPDRFITVGTSIAVEKEKADGVFETNTKTATISINDDRYVGKWGRATLAGHFDTDGGQLHTARVLFGDGNSGSEAQALTGIITSGSYVDIGIFKREIPVAAQFYNYHLGCATISVKCELSEEAKRQWQIETFNAIIDAYEERLKEYNDKMAELKAVQTQKLKLNPLYYRQIENILLRKNCIEYMISNDVLGKDSMLTGSTLSDLRAQYDNPNLESYAAKVKFFEQAFEWNLMSYYFYPFYWANRRNWLKMYNVEEADDPIFRSFLQCGMAKVIVTVRPGFEEAVNWFMATGQVWNGGQVPTFDDPLYVSIVTEMQVVNGVVEETWESRVPTSLTVIQAGTIGLNVEGLPCDVECEDNLLFDSDGEPVLDANGDQMGVIDQNLDAHGNPVQLGNITDDLQGVSQSIEEIKDDIEEIKTTLEGMS